MKPLVDLKNIIAEKDFIQKQFSIVSEKNILFINPQLSSKDLYRVFLPYFSLSETCATAIHHISNYNPIERIIGGKETQIEDYMIEWANCIVFPFTTQPLVAGLYKRIRALNPMCKIVYLIDFNFYELLPTHPFYDIFKDETTLKYVEDNMFYSDIVIVSNKNLQIYLLKRWQDKVIPTKYKGLPTNMAIGFMPFVIDEAFMKANIDFTPEKLLLHKKEKEAKPSPKVQKRLDEAAKAAKRVTQKKVNKKNKAAKQHKLKSAQKNTIKKNSKHAAKHTSNRKK